MKTMINNMIIAIIAQGALFPLGVPALVPVELGWLEAPGLGLLVVPEGCPVVVGACVAPPGIT